MDVIVLVIPLVAMVSGVCMIIFLRYYDNIERMAMIEKGMAPTSRKRGISINSTLRIGCLLVGVGIGLLVGAMATHSTDLPDGLPIALMMIFGGAGLLTAYVIEHKMQEKDGDA